MDSQTTNESPMLQNPGAGAPPLAAGCWPSQYLPVDTSARLTAVTDRLNAGELSRGQVRDMLRADRIGGAAISHLGNASYEVGRWLAANGTASEGFKIAVVVTGSQVLIEFTDHGERTPDPYRFRTDAAMAYSVLTPYVVGWGWRVSGGVRTMRIYGDTASPAAPGNGSYFE